MSTAKPIGLRENGGADLTVLSTAARSKVTKDKSSYRNSTYLIAKIQVLHVGAERSGIGG